MYNSGQWYLTAVWEQYHRLLSTDGKLPGVKGTWAPLHRILMDGRPGADPWIFFNHGGHGGTWGAGDDWFWAWVGVHWIEFVAEVSGAIVFVCLACVCCVRFYSRRKRAKGYKAVSREDVDLRG
jgi:inositol phosphorylceramide mannosyltransferase catalytic subunit